MNILENYGNNENPKTAGEVIRHFREACYAAATKELLEWRDGGGKVVGYYCSYVPEELVTAAGAVSVRLRARTNPTTDAGDTYYGNLTCSYIRHSWDLAIKQKYDFIDGVIVPTACDSVRRIHDNWSRYLPTFSHQLVVPRRNHEESRKYFREELVLLKNTLERNLGTTISDERLREAIRLHNRTRQLLRKLYELRKQKTPPISGADTLAVVVAGTGMPKEKYNALLEVLVAGLEKAPGLREPRARLMVVGSCLDDPSYLDVVEAQGGLVVCDSLCFGSRIFAADVEENTSDLLDALVQQQIACRPQCPHVSPFPPRAEYVEGLIKDYNVDGVICERMQMCDNWGMESYLLTNSVKLSAPILTVDREYFSAATGQLSTRVQAFLESMEGAAR